MGSDKEDLNEILGFHPRKNSDDPRWDGDPNGIDIVSNGAFTEIENLFDDTIDPLDVDQNPYITPVTDDDGVPGFRPFADAANDFNIETGLAGADVDQAPYDETMGRSRGDGSVDENIVGDEFHEKLRQRVDATVGYDGSPRDDLSALAGAQQAQHEAAMSLANYVRVNPPTASRAVLGGRVISLTADLQGKPPIQVVNWVGDDIEACPITVSLNPSIIQLSPKIEVGGIRAFADIIWGSRDGLQQMRVDIGAGTQFTIAGSVVYVSLGIQPFTVAYAANVQVTLNASIAFYTTNKAVPVTYTDYLDDLGNGATSEYIFRPSYAAELSVEKTGADAFTIHFYNFTGTEIYTRVIAAGTYQNTPISLSQDVAKIKITNSSGSAQNFRVIWQMAV